MRLSSRRKTYWLSTLLLALLFAALAALALPPSPAGADIGPKPTVDFEFVQDQDPPLSILSGVLLECSDLNCLSARPIEQVGPQRFTCTESRCSGMAYGYPDNLQLRVEFSDGVTRQSNVFTKRHFNATYRVTVGESDLTVRESGGTSEGIILLPLMVLGSPILLGVCGFASLGLLGVTIAFAVRGSQGRLEFSGARGLYLLAWAIGVVALAAGAVVSWAVPITVVVEEIIAVLYSVWRKRDRVAVPTAVLIANLITLPVFVALIAAGLMPSLGAQLLAEAVITFVEAIIIYLILRLSLTFREALVLSLVLNTASFVMGWLIPV